METTELNSILPFYVQRILNILEVDKSDRLTNLDGDFFVTGTSSLRDTLFDKQAFFFRETGLTNWSSLVEQYGDTSLFLTKSLRTHGTNRGAFYYDKIAWPDDLSEESLAVFLLKYFLAPLSDQLDDQILLQFHLASQYFERVRSGKELLKPHVSGYYQNNRERLSSRVHELLSQKTPVPIEWNEKLLSAVIHSGYRSLLNVLGWSMYFLSGKSAYVQSFYKERNPEKIKDGCRWFIYETMRLFPSAWILHRKVKKDVIIGNVNLSENTDVYIPIISFHRSAVFYDDPYSFDPSRFIKKSIDPWAYLPFGRGMYACPGLHTGIFLAEQFVFDLVNEDVRISSIRKEKTSLIRFLFPSILFNLLHLVVYNQ